MILNREIYVDYDHTLFDTDFFFWVDVVSFLKEYDISSDQIAESYFSIHTGGYTIQRHLMAMGIKVTNCGRILADFNKNFADLSRYLFPDALEFLKEASIGNKLSVLSFGSIEWQKMKVKRSGIEHYFSEKIFTAKENSKAVAIQEYHQEDAEIIVIDNSPKELDKIKEEIPSAQTFLLSPRLPNDFFLLKTLFDNKLFVELRRYVAMTPQFQHKKIYSLAEVNHHLSMKS